MELLRSHGFSGEISGAGSESDGDEEMIGTSGMFWIGLSLKTDDRIDADMLMVVEAEDDGPSQALSPDEDEDMTAELSQHPEGVAPESEDEEMVPAVEPKSSAVIESEYYSASQGEHDDAYDGRSGTADSQEQTPTAFSTWRSQRPHGGSDSDSSDSSDSPDPRKNSSHFRTDLARARTVRFPPALANSDSASVDVFGPLRTPGKPDLKGSLEASRDITSRRSARANPQHDSLATPKRPPPAPKARIPRDLDIQPLHASIASTTPRGAPELVSCTRKFHDIFLT